MRIIAGLAKGIQLISPPASVRPPTDRIKESIFASLEPLVGLVVVDLFSGSGSMGLEALSRGAREVYMVERDPRHARIIRQNVERVGKAIGADGGLARVLVGDASQAARMLPGVRPDIILADPPFPFAIDRAGKGAVNLLANRDLACWAAKARFIVRQSVHHAPFGADGICWRIVRDRRYGESIVYVLEARLEDE